MMDEVIKPVDPIDCPWCHSKYAPRLYGWHEPSEDGKRVLHRYAVRCLNCGAQGPKKELGPHAVAAWNQRAQPTPIPDNPDGNDPLGLHVQRWVRVDRNTLVGLQAVLRGDASAPLRLFAEMLARRMEEALNTPQEQDAPAMPQADWSDAPGWAMWWAVDANQNAYWYKTKPEISFGTWEINSGSWDRFDREVDLPLGIDWRLTLQRRPGTGE